MGQLGPNSPEGHCSYTCSSLGNLANTMESALVKKFSPGTRVLHCVALLPA